MVTLRLHLTGAALWIDGVEARRPVKDRQKQRLLTTYPTTYESIRGGTQRYGAVPAVRGSGADTQIRTEDLLFTKQLLYH